MRKFWLLFLLPLQIFAQNNLSATIQAFAKTSAVSGREDEAAAFVLQLFKQGICKKDKLGNIIIQIGSGSPKKLLTTALDEPGYVISQIQEDGYLRIAPVGYGFNGTLAHQFIEGNEISINTDKGKQFGICAVPSQHYDRGGRLISERSKTPFQWQEAFIDVGAALSKDITAKGIQLLDPLTLNKKPVVYANNYIAAPSIASKAAVIALATVAKTLMNEKAEGTIVIAFTTLELLNGKGIEAIAHEYGPFDEVYQFNRFLKDEALTEMNILVDKHIPSITIQQKVSKPLMALQYSSTGQPEWNNAKLYALGLSADYHYTPVETINTKQAELLIQAWLQAVQQKQWNISYINTPQIKNAESSFKTFNKEANLLSSLIAEYGVNPQEKKVRDCIISQLPAWAKYNIDEKGNLSCTFGNGKEHIVFVAHMDEVGYVVDSIRENGILVMKDKGGSFNWVWEAHPAVIHTNNENINAVFEPRTDYQIATKRFNNGIALTVNAGYHSKQEATVAGITEGITTVTMLKKMIRLSEDKAAARSFDDRVGCAALIMALQNINPNQLPFKVTFIWSVGEEIGLVGSTFAAKNYKDAAIAYPIDTYVSSDAPTESKQFGYCPLGNGAVIRVLESINFINKSSLTYLQNLAKKNNIKTQYGMTIGGTDGQGFLSYGIPSVPLSWPGRYSHSPVEIMDFHDIHSLIQLIQAIMKDNQKKYN